MSEKIKNSQSTVSANRQQKNDTAVCWTRPGERLREGMICPRCQQAKMEYNGLLQLTCPECGLTEAGACT